MAVATMQRVWVCLALLHSSPPPLYQGHIQAVRGRKGQNWTGRIDRGLCEEVQLALCSAHLPLNAAQARVLAPTMTTRPHPHVLDLRMLHKDNIQAAYS